MGDHSYKNLSCLFNKNIDTPVKTQDFEKENWEDGSYLKTLKNFIQSHSNTTDKAAAQTRIENDQKFQSCSTAYVDLERSCQLAMSVADEKYEAFVNSIKILQGNYEKCNNDLAVCEDLEEDFEEDTGSGSGEGEIIDLDGRVELTIDDFSYDPEQMRVEKVEKGFTVEQIDSGHSTLVIVPQISAYTVQFLAPNYYHGYYDANAGWTENMSNHETGHIPFRNYEYKTVAHESDDTSYLWAGQNEGRLNNRKSGKRWDFKYGEIRVKRVGEYLKFIFEEDENDESTIIVKDSTYGLEANKLRPLIFMNNWRDMKILIKDFE